MKCKNSDCKYNLYNNANKFMNKEKNKICAIKIEWEKYVTPGSKDCKKYEKKVR